MIGPIKLIRMMTSAQTHFGPCVWARRIKSTRAVTIKPSSIRTTGMSRGRYCLMIYIWFYLLYCPGQAERRRLAAVSGRLATMVTLPLWLGV